jgi:hypothetical protein
MPRRKALSAISREIWCQCPDIGQAANIKGKDLWRSECKKGISICFRDHRRERIRLRCIGRFWDKPRRTPMK